MYIKNTETGLFNYICNVCNLVFDSFPAMRTHRMEHAHEGKFNVISEDSKQS